MTWRKWNAILYVLAAVVVAAGTTGAAVYANLSYDVTDPAGYGWLPPFVPGYDANMNDHLGAEYFKIAEAVVDGRGYADPFGTRTGPTAWMPPVLTLYEAGLLWAYDRDKPAVANVVIVTQAIALVLTGLLTLAVAWKTAPCVPAPVVAALIGLALTTRFHSAFQVTHDSWLVLLAVDFLVVGVVWGRVFDDRRRAVLWGVGGGVAALVSPVTGLCWGVYTLAGVGRPDRRQRVALALVAAGLTASPWVVRNWVVFGRLIPVKSNLAYELYQSQCLSPDGRLHNRVFGTHPYAHNGAERAECAELGEIAFLDVKRRVFWDAVRESPWSFVEKAYDRLLAATVDYSPMDNREYERGVTYRLSYLAHAVPIFAAVGLLLLAPVRRLHPACWAGLGLLACYLVPYVVVSYYERYEFPLWGLKVLVVVWWLDALLPPRAGPPRQSA